MAKLIAALTFTAPDPNYVDARPLRAVAKKLRKGPPAYMKCPANVVPDWTAPRFQRWTISDSNRRKIPNAAGREWLQEIAAYVAEFERMNNLLPTVSPELEPDAAQCERDDERAAA